MSAQVRLFETPLVGLYPIDVAEANEFLGDWHHKLGPCVRPFHSEAFGLEVNGRMVAVAISASTVSSRVAEYRRNQVVELARLAGERWATRIMVRLWRQVCAPAWPCWLPHAAVSYSHNAMHSGNLYRFDGWEKVREDCGSSGGGTWSKPRTDGDAVRGTKTLWLWRYHEAAA